MFYTYLDGSTATDALTNPVPALEPPAGAIPLGTYKSADVVFGGTDTANQTINYQVIGWRFFLNEAVAADGCWVPTILAKGVATLGTLAYTLTKLGAATNLFADTITKGTDFYSVVKTTVADDAVALLGIDVRGFSFLSVGTDRGTAVTVDVFVQLNNHELDAPTPVA